MESNESIEMPVSHEELRIAMSELYNSGHFELVADNGARVLLVDKDREQRDECDECGHVIPAVEGGELANKHHAESCSLYDAANE
ncbi:hypothetical protein [Streptomyces botrytidirepellens]|uniref:Uncharacterized protein n=1 Tax=Streptomyces botrytidirepellens TaxID=2486417 RepID=A0A3M8VGL5_9ACTN|nr:hypothetical protein [Streptomyces botrytidirepellens]RNG15641.1 hypothetical protein EEJ42_30995 [Streptomyces botrytidirepellens]